LNIFISFIIKLEKNLKFDTFLKLMISARTVGIYGDEDGGRMLPEAGNGDGDEEYFKWWSKE
jgi:hypothetical protein